MTDMFNIDPKIKELLSRERLSNIIDSLELDCNNLILEIFCVVSKLIHYREVRSPVPLSHKRLVGIIRLALFHVLNNTTMTSEGNMKILSKETSRDDAEIYFIDNILGKIVKDKFGRKIEIPDSAIDTYYKDDSTGRHTIADENYKLHRARRLPWVIPTFEKTKEIYALDKPKFKCTDFFYVSKILIPYIEKINDCDAKRKHHINYFIAVARRKYNMKSLEFVSLYPIVNYFDLLKYLEKWKPLEE